MRPKPNTGLHAYLFLHAVQKLSNEQPPMDQPPQARVSTVTPASASILDRIGAWPALAPPVSAAFGSMQVCERSIHALACLANLKSPSEEASMPVPCWNGHTAMHGTGR